MRPGPRMASNVRNRAHQLVRGAVSGWAMVPRAPLMSPTCAESSTALRVDETCVGVDILLSSLIVVFERKMRTSGIRKGVCRGTTASLAYGGKARAKLRDEGFEALPERDEFVRFAGMQREH